MILGISVDISDCAKMQLLIKKYKHIIQHIQIYLDDSPLSLAERTIMEFYDSTVSYSLHAGGNINLANSNDLATAILTIDMLSSIGGIFVNFHVGHFDLCNQSREAALHGSVEAIRKLCSYAHNKNVGIHIENDIRSSDGLERLGTNLPDWSSIFQIDQENFHMCYDVGHACISFGDAFVFQQIMPKIASFHIHNNDGVNDLHIPFGSCGIIPLDKILSELKCSNKFVILENSPSGYDGALQSLSTLGKREVT